MSDAVRVECYQRQVVVRLIRPEIRNPLSIEVLERLDQILDCCQSSTEIDVVIFTGTNDVFASGADLREIAGVTAEKAAEFARLGQDLMNKIAALPSATIAAINGYCFGGALDLALACDRRFASPNTKIAHPGAGLGIITGWGGTQRLPRLIGQANALEMFFTANPIDAEMALRRGLIDEVVDDPLSLALSKCNS